MDDRKTYHDCLVEIHQRRGNNANSNNSNRNTRVNNLKKKMDEHYVDPNK